MKRRDVIVGLAGAVAMHGFAHAQGRSGLHHIAILLAIAEADPFLPRFIEAAQQGLQSLGWKLESSLHIEVRVAGFDPERLKKYAEELVALRPEVILVLSTAEIRAVRKKNATVPIVFAYSTDPVADGIVESLARPGGPRWVRAPPREQAGPRGANTRPCRLPLGQGRMMPYEFSSVAAGLVAQRAWLA